MKSKIKKIVDSQAKKITRKEAIRKAGFIAVSAATTMILLSNPNKANAAEGSPAPPPGADPGW